MQYLLTLLKLKKRAFYDLVLKSKIKTSNVYVVDKPVADAIGAGLDVTSSKGYHGC